VDSEHPEKQAQIGFSASRVLPLRATTGQARAQCAIIRTTARATTIQTQSGIRDLDLAPERALAVDCIDTWDVVGCEQGRVFALAGRAIYAR
jgi:hypothetical protein